MSSKSSARLRKVEELLVLNPQQREELQDLTVLANLPRVSTAILMELLLDACEALVDPDHTSELPEFVAKEINRPASERLLLRAKRERQSSPVRPEDIYLGDLVSVLGQYVERLLAATGPGCTVVPYGFCQPGWDRQRFLDRWNRLKSKVQPIDRQGVE